MHVAFINPQGNFDPTDRGWTEHPDFGGQLVYVKEVALALGERGVSVDILTRRMNDPDWPEFGAFEDRYPGAENVRILRFACGPEGFLAKEELWPHLATWKEDIVEFYRSEGGLPDIAAGHYADGGLVAALLQEKERVPFTFTGHSLGAQKMDKLIGGRHQFEGAVERFSFDKRIAAERLSLARSGQVVVSTAQERFQQYGHRLYRGAVEPSEDEKFTVIPPGVNLEVFGADRKNAVEGKVATRVEAMIRRDIPGDRQQLPVVICSSRLDRKKNHMDLVRAWAVSSELRQSANLMMIIRGSANPMGERERYTGEQRAILNEMAAFISSNRLDGCITAFGLDSQAELAACYRFLARRRRGIFALTAVYEPFGLALLEAMAAGLAAVATKSGGPSESLNDEEGEYGVLVDPQDPRDIARRLVSVIRDAGVWEKTKDAGMRRVTERYTWDQTAEAYLQVLEDLLRGGGKSDDGLPVPGWFTDQANDDIGPGWLSALYFD